MTLEPAVAGPGGQAAPTTGGQLSVPGDEIGRDSLSQLFREAVLSGPMAQAFGLLSAVARTRPSYSSLADLGAVPQPVRLADGPGRPRLVCVSTPMATGGAYQLARLASYFGDVRPVSAVPLSGFVPGEKLADSAEAAIEVLAASVLEAAEGEPFVLVGYSAGGLLAHVTAGYLESVLGIGAEGLVLLDTYRSDSQSRDDLDRGMVISMLEKEHMFGRFDSARLATMGRYVELVPKIVPGRIEAPVLFVQCLETFSAPGAEPAQVTESDDWMAHPWDSSQDVRQVRANHFSMLESEAAATAGAIEDWLAARG